MSTASTAAAVPALAGAAASPAPLPDRDLLDDHHLRRTRLREALRRGAAPARPGVRWGHVAGGVVVAAMALGGTAVAATVDRALDQGSAGPSGVVGVREPRPHERPTPPPPPATDDGVAAPTPPAVPYAPWAQNRSQTSR